MPITDDERLRLFRSVATQVRRSSIVSSGQRIGIELREDSADTVGVYVLLLADEPFRSLAMAIRLTYLQKEEANFGKVCNQLRRTGTPEVVERVARVQARFKSLLLGDEMTLHVGDGATATQMKAQQIFDHWLNGVAFHQVVDRQEAVRQLERVGSGGGIDFAWNVQSTALELASCILELDDICAEHLKTTPSPTGAA